MRRHVAVNVLVLTLSAGAAHAGSQSVLDAAGPNSSHIQGLWWLNFWVAAVVYVLVLLAGAIAAARPRRLRESSDEPDTHPDPRRERLAGAFATSAVVVTVVLLFVLFAGDLFTGIRLHRLDTAADPLDVRITGNQWWWDVEYQRRLGDDIHRGADRVLRTANEIHIPVGRPIRLTLRSQDVIHSFWAPNLEGKKDLVPGHPTTLVFQADRAGRYTGQCAEYCGEQHAHMRFDIVAEEPGRFDQWMEAQLREAPEPQTESQKRGRDVFVSQTCMMCHAISGTTAQSRFGPDLTHVASRSYIAGGSLPNTRGYLAGWIVDPQHLKPGAQMPSQTLAADDIRALLDYLETLK